MEDLKLSEEYKKAYNQADMICTYMPHLLDGIHMPKGEPTEYTKGFEDRLEEYRAMDKAVKNSRYQHLDQKYSNSSQKDDKTKDHDSRDK